MAKKREAKEEAKEKTQNTAKRKGTEKKGKDKDLEQLKKKLEEGKQKEIRKGTPEKTQKRTDKDLELLKKKLEEGKQKEIKKETPFDPLQPRKIQETSSQHYTIGKKTEQTQPLQNTIENKTTLQPAQTQTTQKTSLLQRLKGDLKNAKVPRVGWTGVGLAVLTLGITAYDWLENRNKEQQPKQKPEQPNQEKYEEIFKTLQNMPQQPSSQQPKPKQPAKPKQVKQPSQAIEQEQKQEQATQPQTENPIQENQNLLMQATQSLQQGNENAYLNALERLVSNHEKFIENVISQQNELVGKMTEILTRPLPDIPKFGASELEQNLRTITQSLVMIASLFAPSDRVPFYVGMVNGMMQAWREQDRDEFERRLTEYKLNLEKDLRERDMQLKAMALGMEQLGRNIGFADRSFQLRWELVQSQWRAELEREKKAMELQKELAKRVWDMEKMFLQHELKLREIEKRGEVQEELTKLRASLRPPKIGSGGKPPKLSRINSEILNRALYQANQYGLRGDAEGMKNLLNTLQNSYNITDYERQLLIQEYQKASQKRR